MHLQQHLRPYSLAVKPTVNAVHRDFDDVGSSSLYWSVDCVSLGISAHHGVSRCYVGKHAAPSEQGCHKAFLFRHLDALVHKPTHAGECLEVAFNQLLGLVARYLQSLRQSECRNAVNHTEVCGFCFPSLVVGHVFGALVENFGGSGTVDVLAGKESLHERLVLADVCHDAQLNLRIVGREERVPVVGDERFADFPSVVVSDRDVLQVRVCRRQASSGRDSLIVGGVDFSRVRVYKFGESIDVG